MLAWHKAQQRARRTATCHAPSERLSYYSHRITSRLLTYFYQLQCVHSMVQVRQGCKVAVSKVPGDAAPQAAQCLLLSGLLQGAMQAPFQKVLFAANATMLKRHWLCAHSKPGQSTSARTSRAQTPGCSARRGGRRAAPLCRTSSGLARCGPRPSRLGGRCACPWIKSTSPTAFALPERLAVGAFSSLQVVTLLKRALEWGLPSADDEFVGISCSKCCFTVNHHASP